MKSFRLFLALALLAIAFQIPRALAFSFGEPPVTVSTRPTLDLFESRYYIEINNTSSEALENVKVYINSAPVVKEGGEMKELGQIAAKSSGAFTITKDVLSKYFINGKPAFSVHVVAKGFIGEGHFLLKLPTK